LGDVKNLPVEKQEAWVKDSFDQLRGHEVGIVATFAFEVNLSSIGGTKSREV
jgi:hypothetical protein